MTEQNSNQQVEQNNNQQTEQQEKEFLPLDIVEIVVYVMNWYAIFTLNPTWFFIGAIIGMGRAHLVTGDFTRSRAGNACGGGIILYFIILLLLF